MTEKSALLTSDTKEIEHPQRMAGLEKLQRGARRRDEGPLWAGYVAQAARDSLLGKPRSLPTAAAQRCHFERPLWRIPVDALLQQRLMSPDPPRTSNL